MGRVNRGVHTLPAPEAIAEDPLGIASATHRVGEPLTVTVYPRIAFLKSCVLHPELGLKQDWAGQKGLLTPGRLRVPGHPAAPTGRAAQPHRLEEHGQDRRPHAARDGGAGRRRHHPPSRRQRRPGRREPPGDQLRTGGPRRRAASPTTRFGPGAGSPSSATRGTGARSGSPRTAGDAATLLEALAETERERDGSACPGAAPAPHRPALAAALPDAHPGGHDPRRPDGPRPHQPAGRRGATRLPLCARVLVRGARAGAPLLPFLPAQRRGQRGPTERARPAGRQGGPVGRGRTRRHPSPRTSFRSRRALCCSRSRPPGSAASPSPAATTW